MYASLVNPGKLSSYELDQFLENGWFRIGAKMFTTTFLTFDNQFYDAIWLRIDIRKFRFSKSQENILKRNAAFTTTFDKFKITNEKSDIYLKYREAMPFEPAKSLERLLSFDKTAEIFDTREVCVYEGEKLIACGIFDMGNAGVEGLVSFYDPDYRKYSLGKLLVIKKIEYCQKNDIRWFYPGYFAPGYQRFDYKLNIGGGCTEFYNILDSRWFSINQLVAENLPLKTMYDSLNLLKTLMHGRNGSGFRLLKYKFYDIGLDKDYTEYGLLTYPYIIHCFSNTSLEEVIIVYDLFSRQYQLWLCHKVFKVRMDPEEGHYTEYLLRPIALIAQHSDVSYFYRRINSILFFDREVQIQKHS